MPRWRAEADPTAATVPEPRRTPVRPVGPATPNRLARARRAASPHRRELTVGGTALDGLDSR
ncbi:hypothetical protein [Mycobacterium genavense]|uniref:hypothetical protein n=1 Tax=Mycobacterium genavense TaxID=36812 RepID=UPI0004B4E1DC|nr:hypothetical protein [Mycobacterium genavense]